MIIILLPGLDGTGHLFVPFIKALPKNTNVQIIAYPKTKKLSYSELVIYVTERLPKEDYILVGESFSGNIAYQIAVSQPEHLKSVIFVASFLSNPRPLVLKLLNLLPSRVLFSTPPAFFIKLFLLGFSVQPVLIQSFKRSLNEVQSSILSFRLKEISKLQVENKSSEIRAIYIQVTRDYLVSVKAVGNFKQRLSNLNITKVDGSHFILQSKPVECAFIVEKEIQYQHDKELQTPIP